MQISRNCQRKLSKLPISIGYHKQWLSKLTMTLAQSMASLLWRVIPAKILAFLISGCPTKLCSIKFDPVTSNSVKPNSISRLQIRKQQIISRQVKFGKTKFYSVTSNSFILRRQKSYPVTSKYTETQILQLQILVPSTIE